MWHRKLSIWNILITLILLQKLISTLSIFIILYWNKSLCNKYPLVSIMTILDFYAWELDSFAHLWIHHITWKRSYIKHLSKLVLILFDYILVHDRVLKELYFWFESHVMNLIRAILAFKFVEHGILVLRLNMIRMVHHVDSHFIS